jgi:hypothetical protein
MAYADRKKLAPDLADALWIIVREMDFAERQWRFEQIEAEGGADV